MCTHCRQDMSQYDWTTVPEDTTWEQWRQFHDGWLYPHGRNGYNSTPENIARAVAACPFCNKGPRLQISSDLLAGLTRPHFASTPEDENPVV